MSRLMRRTSLFVAFAVLAAVLAGCAATEHPQPLRSLRLVAQTTPAEIPDEIRFALCPLQLHALVFPPSFLDNERPLGLCLRITNRSAAPLQVDWNRVTLVLSGRATPVIHKGVQFVSRAAPMTPSTIPPGAALDDFIYPREVIQFVNRQWRGPLVFEALPHGSQFELFLPMLKGRDPIERQFVFEIVTGSAR